MTTLILVQTPDDVIFGVDSLTTYGSEQNVMTNMKAVVNNGVLFLVGGIMAYIDLVEQLEFPAYDGSDPRKWISRELSPRLRTMAQENEDFHKGPGNWGVGLLVVVDGQAFELDTIFSPGQNTAGIYTVGTGGDYARGALYQTKRVITGSFTQADVIRALEVAASIDAYTGGALIAGSAKKFIESEATRG